MLHPLILCRAHVLFPQGPVSPPAEFSHRELPSFMNSMSALSLGSVPALVRTTAQKPLAVSGKAFVSSLPSHACLPWLCVLFTEKRRKEKEDKVGPGEGRLLPQTPGKLSACSLPVRVKLEILSQSRGRVAFRRSSPLLCDSPHVAGLGW